MLEFVFRTGSLSLKYDALEQRFGCKGLLPLWVADMDCCAPQTVQKAIAQRLKHGVYGYSCPQQNEASQHAVVHWLATRHGVIGLQAENCQIFAGVLEALATCIETFCSKDEAVMLHSPAYNCFYSTIEASGRPMVENYLQPDNSINFQLLERQIQSERVRLLVFCSPHNPTGKVWSQAEILELLRICQKYGTYFISDEIHFDLVYSAHKHLCSLRQEFSSLHENIIMLSAPNKTFNIPALRSAYLVSRNRTILREIRRFCTQFQTGDISLLGHLALEACYTQSESISWLEELLAYLEQNRNWLSQYLQQEFSELQHRKPDATYLYWVNCQSFLGGDPSLLRKFFIEAGLALGWGELYHGSGWVRINFGCELALLEQALTQWKQAYQKL